MTHKKNELMKIDNSNTALQVENAAWNSLSEESQKAYASDYKLFFKFVNKDPQDITASDILSFIEYLEKNNYKNRSINRKMASLSKMFKVMVVAGKIPVNPVDVLKQFKNISHKTSSGVIVGITMDDIKKVVKVTKKSTPQERKMSMIIRMLAKTGLRISEFTGIKNSDVYPIDDTTLIINIVGKGKKERKIYIEKSFMEEIRDVWPPVEGIPWLFYTIRKTRYDRKVIWKQMKETFMDKIGKDVHPHMLRHAFITHKISVEKQDIKAVSRYAGHSDIATTLNMYVDTALDVNQSKIKI